MNKKNFVRSNHLFLNHFLISKDESGDGPEDDSEDTTVEKGN